LRVERGKLTRGQVEIIASMKTFARRLRPLVRLAATAASVAVVVGVPAGLGTFQAEARVQAPSGEVDAFYRLRGGRPLWLASTSANAAQTLIQQLATAQSDNLNPRRYDVRALQRTVQAAMRGDPSSIQRADMLLSQAYVAYARDSRHDPRIGIIYVDSQLRPTAESATTLLNAAATAPNLAQYVQQMGWMNPIYARIRQAIASRMYRSDAERRLLMVNLERARALPAGNGRYVIVNPPAARLYMYENGQVVDSMRVVAGRPDPVAQTPMMNAFIRYVALNPYWNSPPDITSRKLAPTILKEGRAYFTKRGYDLVDQFGPDAHVLNPMSVDWHAVAAGRVQVNLRQRPGPANSMGKMKFMFPNAEGIWLHDTPENEKIEDAARLQSNGCVRLEAASRLERWLFNGRAPSPKGARPEQKVNLPQPVPLYITYLTAVPSGSSIVYFDDFYGKDRTAPQPRMAMN
jgi:murein L,D-transpeptidase YcbB/YkuD